MKNLMFFILLVLVGCVNTNPDKPTAEVKQVSETHENQVLEHPDWSDDATIYEVNVRQHTLEGTFDAFTADIPRIKEMGIEILWLMPIHPIGETNRKGTLGSYYSVKDYKGINPEFGDLAAFKRLVRKAHDNDMKVIIDWVANHSAFDCDWTINHPEYYLLDSAGSIQPPLGTDWTDVAQLDWENQPLWDGMIDALKYWVEECDIDGYRCDVAEKVPTKFWERAREELDQIKPVFMLAEAEVPEHHLKAFDMSYSWEFMHIMNQCAKKEMTLTDIDEYMQKEKNRFPINAYRMTFTTNHDENSWNGTVYERYGDAHLTFATLAYTLNGMPLLYSGQEAGNQDRLEFFEKDTINWNGYPLQEFYSKLMHLNKTEKALWNGHKGGTYSRIETNHDDEVFAYSRKNDESEVYVVLNFSDESKRIQLQQVPEAECKSIFNKDILNEYTNGTLTLEPFGYQIFVK